MLLNYDIVTIIYFGSFFMQIVRGVYVDSFRLKRPNSIYFLTHWHADHYYGLTTKWPYGPIFCSETTKKILLTKYPKLNPIVHGLQLQTPYLIETPQKKLIKIRLYNSNHIAGSVIILFYVIQTNRYILHTGDMRFNYQVLNSMKSLFRYEDDVGEYRCRYDIDTLYLDNTYCDPIFMFPNRSDALKMIKDIIDKWGPGTRMFYLVTDSIGKQQAFVGLSLMYDVKITLCDQRMQYIKQMYSQDVVNRIFCHKQQSKSSGSWIEVIKRKYVDKVLQEDPRAIAIKLTGWANIQNSHAFTEHQYIVPYSLHSNYNQLQLFMSVIKPKILLPVVRISHNKSNKFRQNIHSYGSYFGSLMHMKQRGFSFFTSNYIDVSFNTKKKSQEMEEEEGEVRKLGGFDEKGNWVKEGEGFDSLGDAEEEKSCLRERISQIRQGNGFISQQNNQQSDDSSSD